MIDADTDFKSIKQQWKNVVKLIKLLFQTGSVSCRFYLLFTFNKQDKMQKILITVENELHINIFII